MGQWGNPNRQALGQPARVSHIHSRRVDTRIDPIVARRWLLTLLPGAAAEEQEAAARAAADFDGDDSSLGLADEPYGWGQVIVRQTQPLPKSHATLIGTSYAVGNDATGTTGTTTGTVYNSAPLYRAIRL